MSRRRKILTQEAILQILQASDSELSDLSEEGDINDSTYEPRIIEGECSSDEQEINISSQEINLEIDRPSTSKTAEILPQGKLTASIKKRKRKTYKWKNEKVNPPPHPGRLDVTQLQILDEEMTPLEYLKRYFPDEFFKDAAYFTNQYSIVKSGKSIKTNAQELQRFSDVNLIMGCVSFSRLKMYWQEEYKYPLVSHNLSRDFCLLEMLSTL
ncbi:hypothetical protein AVEN_234959-1 [Araneus ventricosus]|uniref:PiggyBac transposable element-derived protein domain-containing protein n=1 Tax=Araneus ventricosus TaxID=182803 RepID=A0A4Y2FNZ3_ARAVE|nr:hypothetical protein AVEN_234959-1 [Araneus ventricosus]